MVLGFNDIMQANYARTVIAALVPKVGDGNTLPIITCELRLKIQLSYFCAN